jgi:hypothetical protein
MRPKKENYEHFADTLLYLDNDIGFVSEVRVVLIKTQHLYATEVKQTP